MGGGVFVSVWGDVCLFVGGVVCMSWCVLFVCLFVFFWEGGCFVFCCCCCLLFVVFFLSSSSQKLLLPSSS